MSEGFNARGEEVLAFAILMHFPNSQEQELGFVPFWF